VLNAARKALSDRYERKFASDIAFKNELLDSPRRNASYSKWGKCERSCRRRTNARRQRRVRVLLLRL